MRKPSRLCPVCKRKRVDCAACASNPTRGAIMDCEDIYMARVTAKMRVLYDAIFADVARKLAATWDNLGEGSVMPWSESADMIDAVLEGLLTLRVKHEPRRLYHAFAAMWAGWSLADPPTNVRDEQREPDVAAGYMMRILFDEYRERLFGRPHLPDEETTSLDAAFPEPGERHAARVA